MLRPVAAGETNGGGDLRPGDFNLGSLSFLLLLLLLLLACEEEW